MVKDLGHRLERLIARVEDEDDTSDDDLHRQLQLFSATGRDVLGAHAGRGPPRRQAGERRARRYEASHGYYSLESGASAAASRRDALERMCRYILRPAIALSRLSVDTDGRVVLSLRHPWRDGTVALLFEPEDFAARLAALVPPRGQHTVRYHGVLAPAAKLRRRVVKRPRAKGERRPAWMTWRVLVQRFFGYDPQLCPACGEPMEQKALIRRGAEDVLLWLNGNATRVLFGPPTRDGPAPV